MKKRVSLRNTPKNAPLNAAIHFPQTIKIYSVNSIANKSEKVNSKTPLNNLIFIILHSGKIDLEQLSCDGIAIVTIAYKSQSLQSARVRMDGRELL